MPLVMSGTSAWQTPLSTGVWRWAQLVMVRGVLSVTVKVAVQVDSLVAPSLTCSVTVVTPRPTRVPAVRSEERRVGKERLQSVATTQLVKSGTGAWQRPLAKAL